MSGDNPTKKTFASEKLKEENASFRILSLITRVENLRTTDVSNTAGDIVAFVGLTKSGKSTLINSLMGTPMICRKDPLTEDPFIEQGAGGNGPKIGVGGESETADPKKYTDLPDSNMAMWDFPGFGDNKGTDQEILNAISYQKILRAQKSVRFVVVASYTLIKGDNPLPFFELLHQLLHICPEIASSLCIVGSKGERGNLQGLLQKAVSTQFPNAEDGRRALIHKSQQLIAKILQNGSFVDFRAPKMDDDVSEAPFTVPNKREIVDCIKKLKGAKMGDIPLVISHEAKGDISGYYEACFNVIKRKIDELCILLKKFMDSKGIDVREGSAAVKLTIYRSGKETVQKIIDESTDFESFFNAIKQVGVGVGSEFADYMARFSFIEDLQSMYKITEKATKGIDEFFNTIKLCLNNGIAQYSSLIAHSEAASAEEKKKEQELAKKKEEEISALKKELDSIKKSNEASMAAAAEARPADGPGIFTALGKTADKVLDKVVDKVAEKIANEKCSVM